MDSRYFSEEINKKGTTWVALRPGTFGVLPGLHLAHILSGLGHSKILYFCLESSAEYAMRLAKQKSPNLENKIDFEQGIDLTNSSFQERIDSVDTSVPVIVDCVGLLSDQITSYLENAIDPNGERTYLLVDYLAADADTGTPKVGHLRGHEKLRQKSNRVILLPANDKISNAWGFDNDPSVHWSVQMNH